LEDRLSWLIFGAGAIGTYVGGSLMLQGQKVVFLELTEAASEILDRGLRLNIHGQEHRILHPEMCSSIADAISRSSYDVAIFALKAYDTRPVLELISPYVEQLPPVLCLQNGVENEETLELVLGKSKVIPGTVTSSVVRRAVGDILLERKRGMGVLGGLPLSNQIAHTLSNAGLNAHLYSSSPAMKWSKMITNLAGNASSAILDMTPAEILSHPGLYELEVAQLREAISVMHAHQIEIIDLPATPIRAFAWLVWNLQPRFSRPLVSKLAGKGRGRKMPSFHIDLYSGRGKSEVDYINGAIVRFGERMGIPTPVNRWMNQTLLKLTQGGLPLEEYAHEPDKYIRAVNTFVAENKQ